MDQIRGTAKFLICVLIFSVIIISTLGDRGKEEKLLKEQNPNGAERAIGITSPTSPWDKPRYWIQKAWVIFSSDSERTEKRPSSAGEVLKEAVVKSFETSKESAEHAAEVAGDAVHKTAKKMKETVSSTGRDSQQEL